MTQIKGTYTDANGEKHDVRDIDYMALLNKASPSPEVAAEWNRTFESLGSRMQARKELIKTFDVPGKIAGQARRVVLTENFITSLKHALTRRSNVALHKQRKAKGRGRKAILQARLTQGMRLSNKY